MGERKRIYTRGTPIDRAIEHIVLDGNNCWLWDGAKTTPGYGHINVGKGRNRHSHIVTYEHFIGPVPEGLELDHLCRVRLCANPWHLEPVTHAENMKRARRETCRRAGHSLADARRDKNGRVRNCRTCRLEKRRSGEWT